MSKADDLLKRLGGNMAESLGVRPGTEGPGLRLAPMATNNKYDGRSKLAGASELAIDRIGPDPDQPRKEFDRDALQALADTMRTRGVLQPIRVRWDEARNLWLIVCGERRYRAAQLAGLKTIPVIMVENEVSPAERLADQLIENAHRADLQPIEQANAFRRLMDEFGWNQGRLASELHLSKATISRSLALLKLPEPLQAQVDSGEIAPSVAYSLARIEDPIAQQAAADEIASGEMNRAEAASVVESRRSPAREPRIGKQPKRSSRTFRLADGAKVTVEIPRGRAPAAAFEQALRAALEQLGQGKAAA